MSSASWCDLNVTRLCGPRSAKPSGRSAGSAPPAPRRRPPPRTNCPLRNWPPPASHGPGFGKAKSVILVSLQGGPSHLDLWDPKEGVPDKVKSNFKAIDTKLPGVKFTELLPRLAKVNDKFTMIRSMSYTPNGLF